VRQFLIVMLVSWLSGCATIQQGQPIDPEKVSQIQRGITTQGELATLLGDPSMVEERSSGRRILIYQLTESKNKMNFWSGKMEQTAKGFSLHVLILRDIVLDYTMTERQAYAEDPLSQPTPYFPSSYTQK
jgi:hypothetical protein